MPVTRRSAKVKKKTGRKGKTGAAVGHVFYGNQHTKHTVYSRGKGTARTTAKHKRVLKGRKSRGSTGGSPAEQNERARAAKREVARKKLRHKTTSTAVKKKIQARRKAGNLIRKIKSRRR